MLPTLQMLNKITVITGPVRAGKTTYLEALVKESGNCYGVICPDIDNRKHVMFLPGEDIKPLEVDQTHVNPIKIGKFLFDAKVMNEISEYLAAVEILEDQTFIIDEIGKLELRDSGYEPGLKVFFEKFNSSRVGAKLIVVIRDYLLEEVKFKYGFEPDKILSI
jgi:nucleoside-triphosphatase THEP1